MLRRLDCLSNPKCVARAIFVRLDCLSNADAFPENTNLPRPETLKILGTPEIDENAQKQGPYGGSAQNWRPALE
jgi:hypothetical protein